MLIQNSKIKIILPKVSEAGHSLAPTSSSLNFLAGGLARYCLHEKEKMDKQKIHNKSSFWHTRHSFNSSKNHG